MNKNKNRNKSSSKKDISPKSDFWFKKIFGEHKEICKNFIESITGLHISTLEYGNTESLGDLYGTKKICFDVNAILNNGIRTNIEMQVEHDNENRDRFALYASRYHGAQLKAGMKYDETKKTIIIHIFDYVFLDQDTYQEPINQYQLLHVKKYTQLSDKLDVFIIELPKIPEICHNDYEKWLTWINDREKAVERGIHMQNKHIGNAESVFNKLANDPATQMAYVSALKASDREKGRLYRAREKGLKEKALETAKIMKNDKVPLDLIIKYSGLSKEEIESL